MEYSLFLLLNFCFAYRLSAEKTKKSIKQTNNAAIHAGSGNESSRCIPLLNGLGEQLALSFSHITKQIKISTGQQYLWYRRKQVGVIASSIHSASEVFLQVSRRIKIVMIMIFLKLNNSEFL